MNKEEKNLVIEALADNLNVNNNFYIADISELNIGDKIYVTEIGDDTYTILHPDNTVVCQVRIARAVVEEEEEEEGEEGEEGAEGEATEGGATEGGKTPAEGSKE